MLILITREKDIMDDPRLPRYHDFNESKGFLGSNLIITIIGIVFLFIVSQSWNDVFDKVTLALFGREPTLIESIFIALIITIIFVILIRYIFHVSLISIS